jgi:hypothetical protein
MRGRRHSVVRTTHRIIPVQLSSGLALQRSLQKVAPRVKVAPMRPRGVREGIAPHRTLSLQGLAIGLGTNNFGPRINDPAAERVLRQALDMGLTVIATAHTEGQGQAEACLGQASRRHRSLPSTGGMGLRPVPGASPGAQHHGRRHHSGAHYSQRQGGGLVPLGRRNGRARLPPASAGLHMEHAAAHLRPFRP